MIALVTGAVIGAVAANAATTVSGNQATLLWGKASGSVTAYVVYVSTNGGPHVAVGQTVANQYTVSGPSGQTVSLRVSAVGIENGAIAQGPLSPASVAIKFSGSSNPSAPPPSETQPPAPPPPPSQAATWTPATWPKNIACVRTNSCQTRALADLDGDGKLEVILEEDGFVTAREFSNRTSIGSRTLSGIPANHEIAVGDFLGEGRDRIVTVRSNGGAPDLWNAAGSPSATRLETFAPPGGQFVVADTDGNGREELIVTDVRNGRVTRWRIYASGNVVKSSLGTLRSGEEIIPGNLDGDGDVDLVAVDLTRGRAEIWINGYASNTRSLAPLPTGWAHVGIGDVNGNGTADLIGARGTGGVDVWLMDGASRARSVAFNALDYRGGLTARDADGDGLAEWLVSGPVRRLVLMHP